MRLTPDLLSRMLKTIIAAKLIVPSLAEFVIGTKVMAFKILKK